MKNIYRNEEIEAINLEDSSILYFNWDGFNQRNLELVIEWCGQLEFVEFFDLNNVDTKLIFENISYFDLKANFKPFSMGAIAIYGYNYEKDENNRYNLYFDLVTNKNNFMKINCESFYFEINNKVKTE